MTAQNQAIAVTIGGGLQLAWLIQACWTNGVHLKLKLPRFDPDVKRLMKLIGPAQPAPARCSSILLVSTALATGLLPHGSVSYIYHADRLNQLPLGLIGIGLGTVLLPTSRASWAGRRERGDGSRRTAARARAVPHSARDGRPGVLRRADHQRPVPARPLRRAGHAHDTARPSPPSRSACRPTSSSRC